MPDAHTLYNQVGSDTSRVLRHFEVLLEALGSDTQDQLYAAMAIQRLCENEPGGMVEHFEDLSDFLAANSELETAVNVLRGIHSLAKHDPEIVAQHPAGIRQMLLTEDASPEEMKVTLLVWMELAKAEYELPPEVAVSALIGVLSESSGLQRMSLDVLGYCTRHNTSQVDVAVVGLSIAIHADDDELRRSGTKHLAEALVSNPGILDGLEWPPDVRDDRVDFENINPKLTNPGEIRRALKENANEFPELSAEVESAIRATGDQ